MSVDTIVVAKWLCLSFGFFFHLIVLSSCFFLTYFLCCQLHSHIHDARDCYLFSVVWLQLKIQKSRSENRRENFSFVTNMKWNAVVWHKLPDDGKSWCQMLTKAKAQEEKKRQKKNVLEKTKPKRLNIRWISNKSTQSEWKYFDVIVVVVVFFLLHLVPITEKRKKKCDNVDILKRQSIDYSVRQISLFISIELLIKRRKVVSLEFVGFFSFSLLGKQINWFKAKYFGDKRKSTLAETSKERNINFHLTKVTKRKREKRLS